MYQVGILLQYNKGTSYTLKELHDNTGMEMDLLIFQLDHLIKAEVILLENGEDIGDSKAIFTLNFEFERLVHECPWSCSYNLNLRNW